MPAQDQKRLPATSPRTIQHAADRDLPRPPWAENGVTDGAGGSRHWFL
jgi:hypothetical protein